MRTNILMFGYLGRRWLVIGVQGSAQAFEYHRHHVTRVEDRGHDHDRFPIRFFSRNREQRDHDHR